MNELTYRVCVASIPWQFLPSLRQPGRGVRQSSCHQHVYRQLQEDRTHVEQGGTHSAAALYRNTCKATPVQTHPSQLAAVNVTGGKNGGGEDGQILMTIIRNSLCLEKWKRFFYSTRIDNLCLINGPCIISNKYIIHKECNYKRNGATFEKYCNNFLGLFLMTDKNFENIWVKQRDQEGLECLLG